MRFIRESLYVAVGFALGMIVGYLLFLAIPEQLVTMVDWKAGVIVVASFIGAYCGYRLFHSGYKLKIWHQILISLILLGALCYSIWFLYLIHKLGEGLKAF